MGSQAEGVIAEMQAMGFERADIERALRAAFFNPDRAIDYLLNVSYSAPLFLVTDSQVNTFDRVFRKAPNKSSSVAKLLLVSPQPHQKPPPLLPLIHRRRSNQMNPSTSSRPQQLRLVVVEAVLRAEPVLPDKDWPVRLAAKAA
jgi:hypothetical protein